MAVQRTQAPLSLAWHLAWFETRNRYSRSVLGPFWMTLQSAIFIAAVGSLMANVFGQRFSEYIASFAAGYIMWTFLSGVVLESTGAFVSAVSFLKDRGVRPHVFIFTPFVRQLIYLAHTIILPFLICIWFGVGSFANLVLAIPGFILFLLTAFLLTAPIAVLTVRFRDARPIIESATNLLFLLSPILWPAELAKDRAAVALSLNPVAHLIGAWREPLLTGVFPLSSILVIVAMDAVLLGLFVLALRAARKAALWV
jgi:lipopolysaccharide transport system permease protein